MVKVRPALQLAEAHEAAGTDISLYKPLVEMVVTVRDEESADYAANDV